MKFVIYVTIAMFLLSACAHPGGVRIVDTGEFVVDRTQGKKSTGFSCVVESGPQGDSLVLKSYDSVEIVEQKNKLVDTEKTFYKYSIMNELVELCAWAVVVPGVVGFFYPLIAGESIDGSNDRLHATLYDSFSMINPFMNSFSCSVSSPYISSMEIKERKSKAVKVGEPIKYEKRIPKGGVNFTAVIGGEKHSGKTDLVGDFHIKSNLKIESVEELEINGEKIQISKN